MPTNRPHHSCKLRKPWLRARSSGKNVRASFVQTRFTSSEFGLGIVKAEIANSVTLLMTQTINVWCMKLSYGRRKGTCLNNTISTKGRYTRKPSPKDQDAAAGVMRRNRTPNRKTAEI